MHRGSQRPGGPSARQIRQRLSKIRPLNCDPQIQSILFTILPPELRNIIFEYAVSEHDDTSSPLVSTGEDVKPGNIWEPRIHTDLCCTCRLIYYETSSIPMKSSTILHYRGVEMFVRNQKRRQKHFMPEDFARFTAKNTAELHHVHFDGWLSRNSLKCLRLPQFRPRIISVRLYPFVMQFDHFLSIQPFSTHCFDRRDTNADVQAVQSGRKPNWQLMPSHFNASELPDSVQEFRVQLDARVDDQTLLRAFLHGIGPQFVTVHGGQCLTTAGVPITFETWWILISDAADQALAHTNAILMAALRERPMYRWDQRCQYTLTYRRNASIPILKDWDTADSFPDDLVQYLNSVKQDGLHIVEVKPRSEESQRDCSFIKWLIARADVDNNGIASLTRRLPAPNDNAVLSVLGQGTQGV